MESLGVAPSCDLLVKSVIPSDSGRGYLSSEFHGLLEHHRPVPVTIKPRCPAEHQIAERAKRTMRKAPGGKHWRAGRGGLAA
jgi:hypothetical protein